MVKKEIKTLVRFLKRMGCKTNAKERGTVVFKYNNVIGAFKLAEEYPMSLHGRICIDNDEVFDKWSKCPIKLPLPRTPYEYSLLKGCIEQMATPYWKQRSNELELKVHSYNFYEWEI